MLRASLKLVRNVLALMMLVVATVYAQGPGGGQRPQGPPSPAMQLEQLVTVMARASVPLSDAQQVAILTIYQDGETAAKGDSNDASADEATKRQQRQELQASVRKAVRVQLTEEQAKVFDAMRQPGPPGSGNGGSFGSAPPSQ